MLRVIWFIILVLLISTGFIWLADNKGSVDINWLGYKITTDTASFCFLVILGSLSIFSFIYLVLGIISFKSKFLDFFRNPKGKREELIQKYKKALELFIDASIALNSGDLRNAVRLEGKINSLVKNQRLKKLLAAQISYLEGDLKKASQLFNDFDDKNAKIISLKSKLEYLLNENDLNKATITAEQIIRLREDDKKTSNLLFDLYKKQGEWNNAKNLAAIDESGSLINKKQDLAVINSALAKKLYLDKNYRDAIKYCRTALSKVHDFFPASLILIKSYVKLGFNFLAILKIRNSWKNHPNLPMAIIHNFIYRKSNIKKRLASAKKLHNLNPEHYLSNLLLASIAIESKNYQEAKRQLDLAFIKNKNCNWSYRLLSSLKEKQNQHQSSKNHHEKLSLSDKSQIWRCQKCHDYNNSWDARCKNCGSYDSLIWIE